MTRLNILAARLAAARVAARDANREASKIEREIVDQLQLTDCGHRITDSEDYRIEASRMRGGVVMVDVYRLPDNPACAEG